MKLRDNPVYTYTLKTYWRGWRLYLLPAITLVLLLTAFLLLLKYAPVISKGAGSLFSMSGAPAADTSGLAWLIYFWVLSTLMGGGAVYLVPGLTVPVLTREYERLTFDPLRLTPMTDGELAGGKLAAASMPFFLCFVVSAPISAAAVILGTIPAWWMLVYYALGAVQTFTMIQVSLTAAAWTKRTATGILLAYGLAIFVIPTVMLILAWTPILLIYGFEAMGISPTGASPTMMNPFSAMVPWQMPTPMLLVQIITGVLWAGLCVGAWYGLKHAIRRRA